MTWKTVRKPVDIQLLSVIITPYNRCSSRLKGRFSSFARGSFPRLVFGVNLIRQDDRTFARDTCQPGQQKVLENGNYIQ